jgi:hypothetical protein
MATALTLEPLIGLLFIKNTRKTSPHVKFGSVGGRSVGKTTGGDGKIPRDAVRTHGWR